MSYLSVGDFGREGKFWPSDEPELSSIQTRGKYSRSVKEWMLDASQVDARIGKHD
jgi:hypothetical protein